MDNQETRQIKTLVSNAVSMLKEVLNKTTALEYALEKRDPPLYKAYLRRLKRLESEEQDNPRTSVVLPKTTKDRKAMLGAPEE